MRLNSNALRTIDKDVSDWNSVTQPGIYSGNGNAKNSPIPGDTVWIDAIVLSSNQNINFLNILAVSSTGVLLCRREYNGIWTDWITIK